MEETRYKRQDTNKHQIQNLKSQINPKQITSFKKQIPKLKFKEN